MAAQVASAGGFAPLSRYATIRRDGTNTGRPDFSDSFSSAGWFASMLLPRFTIRALLVILTVCACVFVVVGLAFRGEQWAWGVTIGVLSLLFTLLVHAGWFLLIWGLARMQSKRASETAKTAETN